ncbi:hypothetical protein [Amycolatopsis sp. cg9]
MTVRVTESTPAPVPRSPWWAKRRAPKTSRAGSAPAPKLTSG